MPLIPTTLRLARTAITAIGDVAKRDGVSWGEAARRVIAWGLRPACPMPPGWHPGMEQCAQ